MQITNFWQGAHLAAASVLGSYAFAWGFSAFGIAGLVALGVDFHEAETGILISALLVLLGVFIWSFSVRKVNRIWVMLVGGGLIMTMLGWLIQKILLQGI
ncbi:MAG: iron uptake protein [Cellvibrionaceae bacterium]|nr:iron uptake protein [Cellvibrionaceae bacterium]